MARLFPAAFIVMGHTHLPERQPTAEHATYVNLGAWAEDEEGVAQIETRTALDDDEPDTEPLIGWWTGFRCGVENDDGYPVETLWKGWSAGCPDLDGSAVHRRFVRGR